MMKIHKNNNLIRLSTLLLCLLSYSGISEARRSHHPKQPSQSDQNQAAASPVAPGQFDYYLLALSWSPEFCSTPAGHKPEKQIQCKSKLGFVVHGLWPQYNANGWPQDCGPAADVPVEIAAIAQSAQPPMPSGDPGLIAHEWSKHGTCSGLSMADYFTAIKTTAEKVSIPEQLKAPETALTLDGKAIIAAFTAANPGMTPEMLNTSVDNKGAISGVEVCFSKELNLQACSGTHNPKGGKFLPVNK
jgi:ribonuclease T2